MTDLVNNEDNSMSRLAGMWDVVGEIMRSHIAKDLPGLKFVRIVI